MEEYASAASEFFQEASDKPFFLSVNYPDAHLPFHRQQFGRPKQPLTGADVKPLPWVGVDSPRLREVTADYYNCLERLDDGIGMLLEALEQSGHADNTLVIYIGDHGAQFPRGKVSVYEGGLRIPFIVRWPKQARVGAVSNELISTVDILPTVLRAAGVAIPESLPGRALQPLLEGTPTKWRTYIYGFTTGSYPFAFYLRWSIRDDRYKLLVSLVPEDENLGAKMYLDPNNIVTVVSGFTPAEQSSAPVHVRAALQRFQKPPRFELFDLKRDPHEWNNLAENANYAEIKQRLARALESFRQRTKDPFLDAENTASFRGSQLSMPDMSYRKRKDFRWPYVDAFREWRLSR